MLQASSGGGVPKLPQRDRCSSPRRARYPYRHGQLCHQQDAENQGVACPPASLSWALHADFGVMDQSGRTLGLPSSAETGSVEVFIPLSGNSKPISAPSSIGTTKIPGPSNGPSLPTKSWLPWNASATKRSRHYAANFRFT